MRGNLWLFLSALILLISLILKQVPLFVLSVLLLLSAGASSLWNRFCLHRVEFSRRLSSSRVFHGEEIIYETEIVNKKILPLPWLNVEDELPEDVTLLKGEAEKAGPRRVVMNVTSPVGIYHKIRRRYPMRCMQRGVFTFGPTILRSGDLFGLLQRETRYQECEHLTVYPRLVPLEKLGVSSKQLFGEMRVRNHLFRDPVLTAGVRDYQPGDSIKRIHWKNSARFGKLQTKVYEPTTTIDLSIFLDVRTVKEPLWGVQTQLQELGIIAAASISRHALESGFRVGLYVNQAQFTSEAPIRVPHSRHEDQLVHILEALAQVQHSETLPMSKFIRHEAPALPWGTTLLVIAAQPTDKLVANLLDLKRPGRSTALIKLGGEPLDEPSGKLPVYHISDNAAWEVIESIGISDNPAQPPDRKRDKPRGKV